MDSNNKWPDFLVIGAGKSGTTSLHHYLKAHPQIYVPEVKEPNFFGYETINPNEIKLEETYHHYLNSVTSIDDYIKLFENCGKKQIAGEVSNIYLYSDEAYKRIYNYIPNVKLIVILRNPTDRIFSRWMHLKRENKAPTSKFEDIFDRQSKWWERPDLVYEGFYAFHLKKFFNTFPENNIKVLFYEDLKNNPDKLLKDIFTFLEVDNSFVPDSFQQYNKSGVIKNPVINNLFGYNNLIFNQIRKFSPGLYNKVKKNKSLKNLITKIRYSFLEKTELDRDTRNKIINEIYREDILQLEKLLNVNLNSWYS